MGNRSQLDTILTAAVLAWAVYAEMTGDRDLKRARQWARYYAGQVRIGIRREVEPGWVTELRDYIAI